MKNYLKIFLIATIAAVALCATPTQTKAQIVSSVKAVNLKDSTVNTDTTSFLLTPVNEFVSLTVVAVKESGTISGNKVYLRGTVDGSNYTTLDSLVISTTALHKTFTPSSYTSNVLSYKSYQLYILGAGTNKMRFTAYQLRRSR